jgi:hypothetical protein
VKEKVCTVCGEIGYERRVGAAQAFLGGLLCVAGLLPGLLYFAALSSQYPQCPVCQGRKCMVPLDSRTGRRLLLDSNNAEGPLLLTDPVPDSPEWNTGSIIALSVIIAFVLGLIWLALSPSNGSLR